MRGGMSGAGQEGDRCGCCPEVPQHDGLHSGERDDFPPPWIAVLRRDANGDCGEDHNGCCGFTRRATAAFACSAAWLVGAAAWLTRGLRVRRWGGCGCG